VRATRVIKNFSCNYEIPVDQRSMIELEVGATPVITVPYRHPKKFKDEIEKAIKELLAMGTSGPA
jgi:hypothetical protein